MNRKLTILITLLAIMALSCSKKEEDPSYYLRAVIDGYSFSATSVTYGSDTFASEVHQYISGSMGAYELTLNLYARNGITGTFTLPNANISCYLNVGGKYVEARTGSLTITKVDPLLEGTFNFICTDSTTIMEGSFSCAVK